MGKKKKPSQPKTNKPPEELLSEFGKMLGGSGNNRSLFSSNTSSSKAYKSVPRSTRNENLVIIDYYSKNLTLPAGDVIEIELMSYSKNDTFRKFSKKHYTTIIINMDKIGLLPDLSVFPNLKELVLKQKKPDMGFDMTFYTPKLKSLEHLTIEGVIFKKDKTTGKIEFPKDIYTHFPNLKSLGFKHCENIVFTDDFIYTHINTLFLKKCKEVVDFHKICGTSYMKILDLDIKNFILPHELADLTKLEELTLVTKMEYDINDQELEDFLNQFNLQDFLKPVIMTVQFLEAKKNLRW